MSYKMISSKKRTVFLRFLLRSLVPQTFSGTYKRSFFQFKILCPHKFKTGTKFKVRVPRPSTTQPPFPSGELNWLLLWWVVPFVMTIELDQIFSDLDITLFRFTGYYNRDPPPSIVLTFRSPWMSVPTSKDWRRMVAKMSDLLLDSTPQTVPLKLYDVFRKFYQPLDGWSILFPDPE